MEINEKTKVLIISMDAGKSLRVLMEQNDISREDLARDLNVSLPTASRMRTSRLISGANLEALSRYFNISPSDFIRIGESGK
jgi:transcriptional regulator with XRE-family HTH domain